MNRFVTLAAGCFLLAFGALPALGQEPFITTWQTDNSGSSEDNQITIPTSPDETYDYDVYWEDVSDAAINGTETGATGDLTITFPAAGTYRVEITGDFPRIIFQPFQGDGRKILTVEQWGDIAWSSMEYAFRRTLNLDVTATDAPDLSGVTSMVGMFTRTNSFNGDIGHWDVSNVTNMSAMFLGANAFNQDLNDWDVSNVTDMSFMFNDNAAFNGDIENWNVSNVTNMSHMFQSAGAFNRNIGGWDVSNVTTMEQMFRGNNSSSYPQPFNQDISSWNVSNVTNMNQMFSQAWSFNQDLTGWDVSNVTDMGEMFYRADVFNGDISGWNVSNVTNMSLMFSGASSFNQDIGGWDVSNITDMFGVFLGASAFDGDISGWDVSGITNMRSIFQGATAFNQDISGWDVSGVTSMRSIFEDATAFNQDISGWDVSNVTDMRSMFKGASSFNQDLDVWDVSSVASMREMFLGATAFNGVIGSWDVSGVTDMASLFFRASSFNQDIGGWDVSSVTDMNGMFMGSGFNQDIGGWDVSNVLSMSGLFAYDGSGSGPIPNPFNQDIGGWDVSNVTYMNNMFDGATAFNHDISGWDVSSATNMYRMFIDASAFNQDIGGWDVSNVTDMREMFGTFWFTNSFNQDIGDWDVSNVERFDGMFNNSTVFNQDIGGWDVSGATNFLLMFSNSTAFNQDIGGWDVLGVTNMERMFQGATAFNQDISGWDVSNVLSMFAMFIDASAFNQDIGGWDVSNVRFMGSMFANASSFNQDIGAWDVSNDFNTSMTFMFYGAGAFDQDLGGWDISGVTNMGDMLSFSGLSVANYDSTLIGWETQSVSPEQTLGADGLVYCAGAGARRSLIVDHDWTFVGDEECATAGPIASISPTLFEFEVPADGSDGDVLNIGNLGESTLSWSIETADPLDGDRTTTLLAAGETEAPPVTDELAGGLSAVPDMPARDVKAGTDDGPEAQEPAPAKAGGNLLSLGGDQMSQTSDTNIAPSNSAACPTGPNHLLRRFYFDEHPEVGNPAGIHSVDIAIQEAVTIQTLTVNLYTLPSDTPEDTIPVGSLVLIGSGEVTISSVNDGTIVNVPVSGTVSDTEAFDLVVEATVADVFYIGATDTGETHPGFIMAPACGSSAPSRIDELGPDFEDTHIIMVVNTGAPSACESPSAISWLSVSPDEGATEPEDSTQVDVTVDATSVEPGIDYTATLCVTTNDPNAPRVEVPVTMTVGGIGTEATPEELADVLGAPSPNPVNGIATLTLAAENGQNVSVEVFDLTGRRIQTLYNDALAPGKAETLTLDASALPAGVYVVRATGEDFVKTRRVTVVR